MLNQGGVTTISFDQIQCPNPHFMYILLEILRTPEQLMVEVTTDTSHSELLFTPGDNTFDVHLRAARS